MKRRLALYKSTEHGFECTANESFEEVSGYVRLSEYVDIDFPDLPSSDIVAKQVAALNEEIQRVQADTERKLNGLRQQRDELLALPQPTEGEA